MKTNSITLKQKLAANELTIGSWITLGHPAIAEIMSQTPFDWLVIDMEHSVIGFDTAQLMIATIRYNGKEALVRVGGNDELNIKRVMDSGATGVIVPMVNTPELAKQAVSFVKYPPVGRRGVGLARAQSYGTGFDSYKDWLAVESIVVAQIEHIDAVNNFNDIVEVEGVDAFIIGPYDLSASMGHPGAYDRKDVRDAIQKVLDISKSKNKPAGFHVIQPDATLVNDKIKQGCTFIAFSIDFFFLGQKCREEFERIKLND